MDLKNWAVVGFKDDTGLGRLAADMISILGIGHQLVVPSERLTNHPLDHSRDHVGSQCRPMQSSHSRYCMGLRDHYFRACRLAPGLTSSGKETRNLYCRVPMWEWFQGNDERWKYCDLFVCPTQMAVKC